tara:strand:- start:50391 stop:50828 length:438 start_codon:yes stop_codon:yes gene_type:complete
VKASASLLSLLMAGCITGEFAQRTVNEPVDLERLRQLEVGVDDLTTCLSALGAPVDVREYNVSADGASGMALVWFWSEQVGWGLQISGAITEDASVSFEFDWAGIDLPGCVLWFDRDLKLTNYREGLVGELLPPRRRPSAQTAAQ